MTDYIYFNPVATHDRKFTYLPVVQHTLENTIYIGYDVVITMYNARVISNRFTSNVAPYFAVRRKTNTCVIVNAIYQGYDYE